MNLILVAISFIVFFVYLVKKFSRPSKFPPGPPWVPYVGNQLYFKKLTKSLGGLHHAFSALAESYNTNILGLKFCNEYVITVLDYPLIREVLIRDDFEGRPNNFFFKMRSFGREKSGITGSEGTTWSTNRTFVLRHFKSLGFGKPPMESMIKTEVDDILTFFKNQQTTIQISKFFAPKVLNILWTLVSGERITGNDTILNDLLDLFAARGKLFDITGGTINQYPWLRFIAPKWTGYTLIQEINTKLKSLVMKMINKHYETWEENKEDDLLYSYISEIKKGENGVFCEEELVAVCFDLFIAGTQTTSGTLDLVFFHMIQNPDIQKKVQEEIDNNIGSSTLTYADSLKLPYTNAVLIETQRYSPVLPIIGPRRAMKDTTLGGYNVPEGTTIFVDYFSMYHNGQNWEEPDKFKPERFLDKEGGITNVERFIPFGLGKRRCLGDVLAKQCLFYFFVEIMRKFDVMLSEDSVGGNLSVGITMVPERFRAKFVPRVV